MSTTLIHHLRRPGSEDTNFWILIDNDIIAAIGCLDPSTTLPEADETIDGNGALVMPGAIDCHVHFREPGMTEKADIDTESHAAVAGGVTSYLEMPNTKPPTTTIERWEEKMALAAEKSVANYAFFIGATNDNIDQLCKADYTRVPGVKLFMGSSTGNMLVDDDESIARLFNEIDTIVAVHAEDQNIISANTKRLCRPSEPVPMAMHSVIRSNEACYSCTARAVKLAKKYGTRLHICHLTTKEELSLLENGPLDQKLITSEVSPHHLMWCADDYVDRGARIKMNPAVKSAADREALRQALTDGLIDMVATDHAPHLLSQKQGDALTAVSGAPLVQFSLPWMLTHFDERLVLRTMCTNPAAIFGIERRGSLMPGNYADIVLINKVEPYTVTDADVISKCGWTPLDGTPLSYRIAQTWVNGKCIYRDGAFTGEKAAKALRVKSEE